MDVNVELINLTPHEVTIRLENGEEIKIPPSGYTVRLDTKEKPVGSLGKIPIVKVEYGDLVIVKDGKPVEDTEFLKGADVIVSSIIGNSGHAVYLLASDYDVNAIYVPNTSRAIRNEKGQIVAVPSLIKVFP